MRYLLSILALAISLTGCGGSEESPPTVMVLDSGQHLTVDAEVIWDQGPLVFEPDAQCLNFAVVGLFSAMPQPFPPDVQPSEVKVYRAGAVIWSSNLGSGDLGIDATTGQLRSGIQGCAPEVLQEGESLRVVYDLAVGSERTAPLAAPETRLRVAY